MSNELAFDCQPNNTQKAISSVYSELLSSNDKLNRRPTYQRNPVWNNEQKSYLINTIMTQCPMPIFLLYMHDEDEEYECIDGQNRLTTIKDYIEQDGITTEPFPYITETDEDETYIFYNNEKTMGNIQKYCDIQNNKKKNKYKKYRLMNPSEVKRFNKYELTLSQIKTKLSFEKRKDIFMRWQNGTSISQCDSFKNESHPFCKFIVENNVEQTVGVLVCTLLKPNLKKNWLWDIFRTSNCFEKDDIKEIIISTLQSRTQITNDTTSNSNSIKEKIEKAQRFLNKIKPLQKLSSKMYISFILGLELIWKKAKPNVREICEKEEFLLDFAEDSLNDRSHNHSTLNNGPQTKAFIESFNSFQNCFYAKIDLYNKPKVDNSSPINNYKKQAIPYGIKSDVWNTFIGAVNGESKCLCCGINNITSRDFQAGHIIPERYGGLSDINNLRPICGKCNSSMGTQNMINYMNSHYPNRKLI
jgi:hypothetical protein